MNIPNLQQLINIRIVDQAGRPTPEFLLVMSQLFTELQQNVSQEGFVIPSQPTTALNLIEANPKASNGVARLLYDNTTGTMKLNNNGTFKEIATL